MFPNYKKIKKKFLFWTYTKKVKDDWEDLGQIEKYKTIMNGREVIKTGICGLCYTRLKIGRGKNNEIFRYCPKCMKKI